MDFHVSRNFVIVVTIIITISSARALVPLVGLFLFLFLDLLRFPLALRSSPTSPFFLSSPHHAAILLPLR